MKTGFTLIALIVGVLAVGSYSGALRRDIFIPDITSSITPEEALTAAKAFGREIEYFKDERTDLCFGIHHRTVSVFGPVDCNNPGVAQLLKEGFK